MATRDYWAQLLTLAEHHDFRIIADECYSEIYRHDPPVGLMQVAEDVGADPERAIIIHSLSKTLQSGWAAVRIRGRWPRIDAPHSPFAGLFRRSGAIADPTVCQNACGATRTMSRPVANFIRRNTTSLMRLFAGGRRLCRSRRRISSFGFPSTTERQRPRNSGGETGVRVSAGALILRVKQPPVAGRRVTDISGWPWSPQKKNCSTA